MAEKVSATANIAGMPPWTISGYTNSNFASGAAGVSAVANQAKASDGSSSSSSSESTKAATPEAIALNNPAMDIDIMADLIFENIGGQELINISRSDIVNGQDVIYTLIKNLKELSVDYNPNNIIKLESTADRYFKNFSIRLESKLPEYGTGPNGEVVYIDPATGDLIINVSSLDPDEQVDVQILNSGETLNGTIYGEV
jgi:hypothetical protein